jgi:hypothetical protein
MSDIGNRRLLCGAPVTALRPAMLRSQSQAVAVAATRPHTRSPRTPRPDIPLTYMAAYGRPRRRRWQAQRVALAQRADRDAAAAAARARACRSGPAAARDPRLGPATGQPGVVPARAPGTEPVAARLARRAPARAARARALPPRAAGAGRGAAPRRPVGTGPGDPDVAVLRPAGLAALRRMIAAAAVAVPRALPLPDAAPHPAEQTAAAAEHDLAVGGAGTQQGPGPPRALEAAQARSLPRAEHGRPVRSDAAQLAGCGDVRESEAAAPRAQLPAGPPPPAAAAGRENMSPNMRTAARPCATTAPSGWTIPVRRGRAAAPAPLVRPAQGKGAPGRARPSAAPSRLRAPVPAATTVLVTVTQSTPACDGALAGAEPGELPLARPQAPAARSADGAPQAARSGRSANFDQGASADHADPARPGPAPEPAWLLGAARHTWSAGVPGGVRDAVGASPLWGGLWRGPDLDARAPACMPPPLFGPAPAPVACAARQPGAAAAPPARPAPEQVRTSAPAAVQAALPAGAAGAGSPAGQARRGTEDPPEPACAAGPPGGSAPALSPRRAGSAQAGQERPSLDAAPGGAAMAGGSAAGAHDPITTPLAPRAGRHGLDTARGSSAGAAADGGRCAAARSASGGAHPGPAATQAPSAAAGAAERCGGLTRTAAALAAALTALEREASCEALLGPCAEPAAGARSSAPGSPSASARASAGSPGRTLRARAAGLASGAGSPAEGLGSGGGSYASLACLEAAVAELAAGGGASHVKRLLARLDPAAAASDQALAGGGDEAGQAPPHAGAARGAAVAGPGPPSGDLWDALCPARPSARAAAPPAGWGEQALGSPGRDRDRAAALDALADELEALSAAAAGGPKEGPFADPAVSDCSDLDELEALAAAAAGNPEGGFSAEPRMGNCSDLEELEALAAAALEACDGNPAGTESAAGDWTDLELDALALSALGLEMEAPEDSARTPVEGAPWEDAGALHAIASLWDVCLDR